MLRKTACLLRDLILIGLVLVVLGPALVLAISPTLLAAPIMGLRVLAFAVARAATFFGEELADIVLGCLDRLGESMTNAIAHVIGSFPTPRSFTAPEPVPDADRCPECPARSAPFLGGEI